MRKYLSAVVLGALLFTACGQQETGATQPIAETTEDVGDAEPHTIGNSQDLVKAINSETNVECDFDVSSVEEASNGAMLSWNEVNCDHDSRAYFTPTKEAHDHILNKLHANHDILNGMVGHGTNWLFVGGHGQAGEVRRALDGEKPLFGRTAPSPSPEQGFQIVCSNSRHEVTGEFASYEKTWQELDSDDRYNCRGSWAHEDQSAAAHTHEFTEIEMKALEMASYEEKSALPDLYGKCASMNLGHSHEVYLPLEKDVAEMEGALVLCPEHPERQIVEEGFAQAFEISDQREQGERFGGGLLRVGEDVQPGTYIAEDEEGFDGCYWERLDENGYVIDNNFISSGFRAQVTIQPTDYSFSSERCAEWVKQ